MYGVAAGPSDKLEQILLPSLERHAHDLAHILVRRGQKSIAQAYNSILSEAASTPDAEGVVLLHDDVEVRCHLPTVLLPALSDTTIGLVGVVGGRGFEGAKWWQNSERHGVIADTFRSKAFTRGVNDVDAVDGLLLALSPPMVSRVRVGRLWYSGFHGYDVEIAAQVRANGKRVVTADLDVFHHAKEGWGNMTAYTAAELAYLIRWSGASRKTKAKWAREMLRLRLKARWRPEIRDSWEPPN